MHTEHSRHPVHEIVNAISRVEFLQGPVETHTDHDSVLGDNSDLTLWHDVELKEILDTDISVLSATCRLGQLTVSARIWVPLSVRNIDTICLHSVRSSVGIWDPDFDAADVSLELESEVVCGRARKVQRVVAEGLDLNGESGESLLSSVEAVPHVVHHTVHRVHVASLWVRERHGLDRAILIVCVERLEPENTQVSVVAPGGRPVRSQLAVGIGINCLLDVRNDLEGGRFLKRLEIAFKGCAFELEHDILWRRARPSNTVGRVGPIGVRVLDPNHCVLVHVVEHRVHESVDRDVV